MQSTDYKPEAEPKEPAANHSNSAIDFPYKVEGSGPLFIYIAGLDGTGKLFFKQSPVLARSYRVVTYPLRDHGKFTYEDLTDDVAAIIRDQGERRAVILGESFGGTIALAFALRHPAMVERLIVVNSFPRFRNRIRIRLAAWLTSALPFRMLWSFRWAAVNIGLVGGGVNRKTRRRLFEALRTVGGEGYARRLRLIAEADFENRLGAIEAPTLLIAGDKDLLIRSANEAQVMAAQIPNAKVKVIKGVGHACLLSDRVCLAELLEEESFLAVSSALPE